MNQTIKEIPHEDLTDEVLRLKHGGYRLVQICATRTDGGYEITYSFALDYEFLNLRLEIAEDTEIISINDIYAAAFLYENEMKDLFGVKIKLISLDYNGNFYRLDTKTPFK